MHLNQLQPLKRPLHSIVFILGVLLLTGCASTSKLTEAVTTNNMLAVQKAINGGSKINEKDGNGQTALSIAASNNNTKLVKYLLKHKANPNMAMGFRQYPLQLAATNGNIEIIKLLLSAGADINQGTYTKPLVNAAIKGHRDIVLYLLSKGADVHATVSFFPNSAIGAAAFYKRWEIVNDLLAAGASPSSALPIAANSGNIELVKDLLAAGADINGSKSYGYPIISASDTRRRENADVIKLLVAAGANPNQLGNNRETALSKAARSGNAKNIDTLIALGANVNTGSALYKAVSSLSPDVVKSLLAAGANPNQEALIFTLISPGYRCTKKGVDKTELAIFKYLMAAGANINKRGKDGLNALHMAASCDDLESVKLLVDSGISVKATDSKGNTAHDLTRPILRSCSSSCLYLEKHSGGSRESSFGKLFATAAIAGLAGQANLSASDTAKVMSATVNDIWVKDGKGKQLSNLYKQTTNPTVRDMINTRAKQQKASATMKQEMAKYQAILKKHSQKNKKTSLYQQQLNRIAGQSNANKTRSSGGISSNTIKTRPSQSTSNSSYKRKAVVASNKGNSILPGNSPRVTQSSSCSSPPYIAPSFTVEGKNAGPYNSVGGKVKTYMSKTCGSDKPTYNAYPSIKCEVIEKIKHKYISNLTRERCTSEPFTFTCSCKKAGSGISM